MIYVFQVGAIILYTYVFQMLAPPPEGTFDVEDENLPIKSPPKNGPPMQVPLLAQDPDSTDSNTLKKEDRNLPIKSPQNGINGPPVQVPFLAQEPDSTDTSTLKKGKVINNFF